VHLCPEPADQVGLAATAGRSSDSTHDLKHDSSWRTHEIEEDDETERPKK
jgi:hypothetical protein